jgi:hypothetical protein
MALAENQIQALDRLEVQDSDLQAKVNKWRSLDPEREYAHSLREVAEHLLPQLPDAPTTEAFATALVDISNSMYQHFAATLFWDFDMFAAAIVRQNRTPEAMATYALTVEEMMAAFGRRTNIAFMYTHDFIYGFDWSRWVLREPEARKTVHPYDLNFVQRMIRRSQELESLIAQDDKKYHKIEGGGPRNPFGFNREPEYEIPLFQRLAQDQLLPVEAWNYDGITRWEKPYTDIRAQVAADLGIPERT